MKKTFIYFLVDADESKARFKIGQSIDPYRRHKTISKSFDLEKSWQMECLGIARDLEWEIHERFAAHRIDADDFGWKDGKTEWFSIACLDEVLELVKRESHSHLFGKLCRIERQSRQVVVSLPNDLYHRIRMHMAENYTTMQDEVVDALLARFPEPATTEEVPTYTGAFPA